MPERYGSQVSVYCVVLISGLSHSLTLITCVIFSFWRIAPRHIYHHTLTVIFFSGYLLLISSMPHMTAPGFGRGREGGREVGGVNGSGRGQGKSTGEAGMHNSVAISSPSRGPLTSLSLPPRRCLRYSDQRWGACTEAGRWRPARWVWG